MAEVRMKVREKSSTSGGAGNMHLCWSPPDRGGERSRDYWEGMFRDELSEPQLMDVIGGI